MISVYAPDEYKKHIESVARRQYEKTDLGNLTLCNAIVGFDKVNNKYGVFDSEMNFIPHTEQRYYVAPHKANQPNKRYVHIKKFYDVDAIYCDGGALFHFGNFLMEGLIRMWPMLDDKRDLHFVLVNKNGRTIPKFALDILGLLGVSSDKIIYINKTSAFRRLMVPEIAMDIDSFYSDAQKRMFQRIAQNAPTDVPQYDKIYMSRTKLRQKTFGEEKIQRVFEKNGFHVIYPETLPFATQVAIMRHCRVLAGVAGTALHLSAFMPDGGHVIALKRNTQMGDFWGSQELINKMCHHHATLIWASVEDAPTEHFSTHPQIIGVNPYVRQFLDDNGFTYDADDISFDATARGEFDRAVKKYKIGKIKTQVRKIIPKFISAFVPTRRLRKIVYYKLKDWI